MLGCLFLRCIGWTLGNAPKIDVREYRMEQSKEDNPEKLTTQEEEKLKNTAQYVWTPLYTNKHVYILTYFNYIYIYIYIYFIWKSTPLQRGQPLPG